MAATVQSVNQDQQQDAAGNLTDVYTITFTLTDKPGTFTVTVPASGDVVSAAKAAIDGLAGTVEEIYGLT